MVPRISHAHSHQAVSSTTHSCPSSLPFSPRFVLLCSPFYSLALIVTIAIITIIIPLCFQMIFSLTSSLEQDNYQMRTLCFNSDFEVNDSLTFAGVVCSAFLPPASRAPLHSPVQTELALGGGGGGVGRAPSMHCILEHCVHAVLDVKVLWLQRMWHRFAECQPIKFSHAKAIFVFQTFY